MSTYLEYIHYSLTRLILVGLLISDNLPSHCHNPHRRTSSPMPHHHLPFSSSTLRPLLLQNQKWFVLDLQATLWTRTMSSHMLFLKSFFPNPDLNPRTRHRLSWNWTHDTTNTYMFLVRSEPTIPILKSVIIPLQDILWVLWMDWFWEDGEHTGTSNSNCAHKTFLCDALFCIMKFSYLLKGILVIA